MSYLSLVEEWHRMFQVPSPSEPTFDPLTVELRARLMREERAELLHGNSLNDRVEILDGLCDFQYVLSGAILMLGLKELMPPDFESPSCSETKLSGRMQTLFRSVLLGMKVNHFVECAQRCDADATVRSLVEIQRVLNGIIDSTGFAGVFPDAFHVVHVNNCAKTWSQETVNNHIAAKGEPMLFALCPWRDNHYIVRDTWGKIRKPPNHPRVDLQPFVINELK